MVIVFLRYFLCVCGIYFFFFFFSSRRRHTRSLCDWSSDVCSSDLAWNCGGLMVLHQAWEEFGLSTIFDFVAEDRKSTRLNSSHTVISYAVFCLKKKKNDTRADDVHALRHAVDTEDGISLGNDRLVE